MLCVDPYQKSKLHSVWITGDQDPLSAKRRRKFASIQSVCCIFGTQPACLPDCCSRSVTPRRLTKVERAQRSTWSFASGHCRLQARGFFAVVVSWRSSGDRSETRASRSHPRVPSPLARVSPPAVARVVSARRAPADRARSVRMWLRHVDMKPPPSSSTSLMT